MTNRGAFINTTLIGVAAGLRLSREQAFGATGQLAPLLKPVPVNVGYSVSVSNLGILAASEQGYFKRHNLDATMYAFRGATEVNEALAGSKIDFGTLGLLSGVLGLSQGSDLRIISAFCYGGDRFSLIVNQAAGIKTYKDLIGKRVAAFIGTDVHLAAMFALRSNGVDPKSVHFVNMSWTDMIAAAARQELDAYNENEPQGSQMLEAVPEKVRLFERLGKYFDGGSMFVGRSQWMKQNPFATRHVVIALWEGERFVREHPREAALMMSRASKNKLSVEAALDGMKTTSYDPRIRHSTDAELVAAVDLAIEQGKISQKPDLQKFWKPAYDLLAELQGPYRTLLPSEKI